MPRYKKSSALSLNRKTCKRPCIFSPSSKKVKRNRIVITPHASPIGATPFLRSPSSTPSSRRRKVTELSARKHNTNKSNDENNRGISKRKLTYNTDCETQHLPFIDENTISDVNDTMTLLNQLVRGGRFSPTSIAYKMFKDALRWHAGENTSSMRYSEETKEFFWTGRRLLGGQFLRFMRGFAHQGMVNTGDSVKGKYDPLTSSINFPVPSDTSLNHYKPVDVDIGEDMKPGIMAKNIDMSAKTLKHVSQVVMFDGKKIIPQSTDIYLLDKEEEPKISDLRKSFESKLELLQGLEDKLSAFDDGGLKALNQVASPEKELVLYSCKNVIRELSVVTKSLREIRAQKQTYLQTLEKKFAETTDAKFKFAINKIRTVVYQINICVQELLSVTDEIGCACAVLNGVGYLYKTDSACVLNKQDNYRELKQPCDVRECLNTDQIPPNLVKQRTPEWFDMRREVKVTGSVLYKAIGLETLSAEKQYFDETIGNSESTINDAQREAMHHGTINEVNAIATVVGKIMPVLYPHHIFYEEGAYVVNDANGRKIIVVSPDGCIRDANNQHVISVEVKCPYSTYVGSTPVYYNVKPRHSLQSLLEAHVLGADEHLYFSWSSESATVFRLAPNETFVQEALTEAIRVYYDYDVPRRPTKLPENMKELKTNLASEMKAAEFVGEFRSLTAGIPASNNMSSSSVYVEPIPNEAPDEHDQQLSSLIQALIKGKKHVQEAFEFQKPIASEVLVYLLSDMDRVWHRELGHGLPIAYLFKGYSLTMGTARRLLDEILNACFTSEVHVPCVTFDGQFARLKDFDKNDHALSLFALQREFWSDVQKLKKTELIDKICEVYAPAYFKTQEATVDEFGFLTLGPGRFIVENENQKYLPISTPVHLLKKSRSTVTNCIPEDTAPDAHEKEICLSEADANCIEENVLEILQSAVEDSVSTTPYSGDIQPSNHSVVNGNVEHTSARETNVNASQVATEMVDDDYKLIHTLLCSQKRGEKWTKWSIDELKVMFQSAEKLSNEVKGQEMHELVNFLNIKLRTEGKPIKQSLRKPEKVNQICLALGYNTQIAVPPIRRKIKPVKSLQSLCISELSKKSYPKEVIAVAYAECAWPIHAGNWYEKSHVANEVTVIGREKQDGDDDEEVFTYVPVYTPEFVPERQQLEVRVMDILSQLERLICTLCVS